MNAPLNALRHHVTGAIERGEAVAIAGIESPAVKYRLIAGRRHNPGAFLGEYGTRAQAIAARPAMPCFIVRVSS